MGTRGRGRRPDYDWRHFGDVQNSNDISVASATLGSTTFAFTQSQTLVRCRGRVGAYLDGTAADESIMILCGLTILSPDAVAAPELFKSDGQDDGSWIWQGSIYLHSGVAVTAGAEEGQFGSLELDSKAMRKVKVGEQLAFVFQTPAELVTDQGGTFDLIWHVHHLTAF